MKNLIILSIVVLSTLVSAFGQKTIYFDQDWSKTKKRKASYYRIIEKNTENTYNVRDYFMNGQLQMTGVYLDSKMTNKEGIFTYLDSSGNKSLVSNYSNGKLEGTQERYYPNGQIRQVKIYSNGQSKIDYTEYYDSDALRAKGLLEKNKIRGEWLRLYPNGDTLLFTKVDSDGSGNFRSYFENGNLMEKGAFMNDYKSGLWVLFDENGEMVVSKDCGVNTPFSMTPREVVFSSDYVLNDLDDQIIIEFPTRDAKFVGGLGELSKYIAGSVNYPEKAIKKGVAGKVFISFVVEVDGSISNVKVLEGPKLLREESIRVVKNMPNWYPGEFEGKKARTRCKLPINYTFD